MLQMELGANQLTITDQEVQYRSRKIQTAKITGIRYGILKQYINGIRTGRYYTIWLTDGEQDIEIECSKGLVFRSSTIEQRFEQTLEVLWKLVMFPLIEQFLGEIRTGNRIEIGHLSFDLEGIQRAMPVSRITKAGMRVKSSLLGGMTADEREREYQHLSWPDYYGYGHGSGELFIFRRKDTRKKYSSWASLDLRSMWNAVCVAPMVEALTGGGSWKKSRVGQVLPPRPQS